MTTAETTSGHLLDGRVRFRQPATGYRAAIDPILMAAAVPAKAGDRVFELGLGAGAAALSLLTRVPGCAVTGIETDPVASGLAETNAADNGLESRLTVINPLEHPDGMADIGEDFDHLMSNPPYWNSGTSNRSPNAAKSAATHEGPVDIQGWLRQLSSYGRRRSTVTLIYPAARTTDLMSALVAVAGDVYLFPLWPKVGREAKRVLIQARIGGKGPSRILPGLVLHEDDGRYTAEAEAILRGAAAIELGG